MAITEWSYLSNPFNNVSKKSFKRMYQMARDHFDKLKGIAPNNSQIQDLFNLGIVEYETFVTMYRKKSTDVARYRIHTDTVERLFLELSSTLIRQWDVKIQMVYDVVTTEYKGLLPYGRKPFQSGAYEERLNEVESLADHLADFPDLSALKTEVESFAARLSDARSEQQAMEHRNNQNSSDLENARLALATKMHGIFGGLIHLYYDDLSRMENFYELKYLRSSSSSNESEIKATLEVKVVAQSSEVLENQIEKDDLLRITNTGNAAIRVFTVAELGQAAISEVLVNVGKVATLEIGANDRLIVIENNETTDGEALIEVL